LKKTRQIEISAAGLSRFRTAAASHVQPGKSTSRGAH